MHNNSVKTICLYYTFQSVTNNKESVTNGESNPTTNSGNDNLPEVTEQHVEQTTSTENKNEIKEPDTNDPISEIKEKMKANLKIEEKNSIPKLTKSTASDLSNDLKNQEEHSKKLEVEKETKKTESEKKDESMSNAFKCRFCGLSFNYMTTLKAHERVHNIDQPYTCNKCGEAFHYMCELEYHAKQHLGYKCDCGRTFYQYTDLLYHTHPGDEPSEAQQIASAATTSALAALALKPTISIDPSQFPVPEFAEKGFEPKHPMKVYSEVRSKPYICQYCSKSYADSRGLAYHMYSHRGEKLFNPRASRYLMCRNENSYISPGADI